MAKVDHQLRSKDQLTVRYYLNDSFIANRGAFPSPEAAPDANINDARIQSLLAGHTHTFSPSLLNELKLSFFSASSSTRGMVTEPISQPPSD